MLRLDYVRKQHTEDILSWKKPTEDNIQQPNEDKQHTEDILSRKKPWKLENSGENKALLQEIPQNCATNLWFFEEGWSEVAWYLAASEANLCRGSTKQSYS